ncbi:MAG: AAA family ATPase [Vulcanimicrobiota bacterium]
MKTLTFFNNKGGVGKTSLVYHLAWMFAELDLEVLVADLDPQANLTSMFLQDSQVLELWEKQRSRETVFGAVEDLLRGLGDVKAVPTIDVSTKISLIPGDLGLSRFEDSLSESWSKSFGGDERSFRVLTAFHRLLATAAEKKKADLVLLDVGPNLGAINRTALLTSDMVVFPVAPDLFSLQGLRNLGPTLSKWRSDWTTIRSNAPPDISVPAGEMRPLGYVLLQHGVFSKRVVKAYANWADKIPEAYSKYIFPQDADTYSLETDQECLAKLKHYRSLMPMAMEARKPIFLLKTADGAIGAHLYAVKECYQDFKALAEKIITKAGINNS